MATVIVNDLGRDARISDVEDFFQGFGRITDVNLKSGYALVSFEDDRDADDACRRLDGRKINGERVSLDLERKPVRRERSRSRDRYQRDRHDDRGRYDTRRDDYRRDDFRGRDRYDRRDDRRDDRYSRPQGGGAGRFGRTRRTKFGLLLKGLSASANWMDIKDMARQYGNPTFAEANRDIQNEGIVTFSNAKDMMKAQKEMDGREFMGKTIQVDFEYPETCDSDWDGDVANDHPPRPGRRSRSR